MILAVIWKQVFLCLCGAIGKGFATENNSNKGVGVAG